MDKAKLEELWIGDLVYVKTVRSNGKYEGFDNDGRVKVRLGFNLHYFDLSEISEAIEEEENDSIPQNAPIPKFTDNFSGPELDLHIEKLNPQLKHASPEQIIDFQIRKSRAFLDFAIKKRWAKVLIVHGKGTGILRKEVEHMTGDFEQVLYALSKNDGGALEVWFQYY